MTTPVLTPPATRPKHYFRWFICLLLFLATSINYMDRQILGILKSTLNTDFRWSETDYANIVTAFTFAYAFGYLFAGRMMDRLGVKIGLPLVVALWSVAAAGHGLVSYIEPNAKTHLWLWTIPTSVFVFALLRMALGIFEGGNFPASIKAVTEWFPIRERALCTGIFNSGTTIGAVVCPLIVPVINHHFGWAMAFYITGALGIAWLILWVLTYDSPDRHPMLSAEERAYIEADRSIPTSPVSPSAAEKDGVVSYAPFTQESAPIPWVRLLGFRATWAYVIGMGLTSPVWWFYLFWIPDFLQKRFGLTQDDVGAPVAAIYLMTLVGSVGGGWLPSLLLARGFSLNAARKISLLIPALCTLAVAMVPIVPTVWTAVLFVGIAASAHQAWSANLYTLVSDTMPKQSVSSVVGIGGLVAGLAAMGSAQAVGHVLQATGSYFFLFLACCIMYLLSMAAIQLLVPRIEKHPS